jgi:tRNA (Thr-GGU) A37 N-methylase
MLDLAVLDAKLRPIGYIRSNLRDAASAPPQGTEGAPDAWLEIDPAFAHALHGMNAGYELIVITWLHLGDRETLEVHSRGDPRHPLTGVFSTRSPHRPNPLGLHRVTPSEKRDIFYNNAVRFLKLVPVAT